MTAAPLTLCEWSRFFRTIVCACKPKYADAIQHPIRVLEDNVAACRIIVTVSRTQRIDIAWLNERYNDKVFRFIACP